MKKALATVLTASMLVSVASAFGTGVSAAQSGKVDGLTMTSYAFIAKTSLWDDAYKRIMGSGDKDYQLNFDDMKMFDETLPDLLDWSYELGSDPSTGFDEDLRAFYQGKEGPGDNNYLVKWEGKLTVGSDMKFTVVGHKIDNGFVLKIDGKKVYEYWGTGYFDHDDDKLPSDLGAVELKKGDHDVEAWYLEIGGGEALDVGVYLDGSEEYTKFADAGITFDMTKTAYHTFMDRWGTQDQENHAWVKAFMAAGKKMGDGDRGAGAGGDGGKCVEANWNYDATIDAMLDESTVKKTGTTIVPRVDTFTLGVTDESYINLYDGYITVDKTGYYLFGCEKVDNGFVIDIVDGDKTYRAYEFWANATWNSEKSKPDDENTWAIMPTDRAVKLEKGKTYGFKAAFLELDGDQILWPRVKYSEDGTNFEAAKEMNSQLHYTTDALTGNDQVDASVLTGEGVTLLNDKIDLEKVTTTITELWAADGPITNIFDDNKDTKFGATRKFEGGYINWQTTEPVIVTNYKIVAAADNTENPRIPVAWTLYGSTDGKTWTILDKVARGNGGIAATDSAQGVYAVDKPAAYSYYKLHVMGTWAAGSDGKGGDQDVALSFADLSLYNAPKSTTPPQEQPGGGQTGGQPGGNGNTPPATGSASVVIAAVAAVSLAGVAVAARSRKKDRDD